MDFLINILYWFIVNAIHGWRMFLYAITYMFFNPIKNYGYEKLQKMGIGTEGKEPDDIVIHNERLFHRLAYAGSLGFGEAYIDGWWDSKKLDEFLFKIFRRGGYKKMMFRWDKVINYITFDLFNLQTIARSYEVAEKHYDLGNDMFKSFLDKSMTYTCAYWKDAKNLDEAQERKMELIGKKLKLKPGMRVLDLGCGWGGLCKFLAETYKVEVVGVNISKEGCKEARERCKGLSVEIRCQDYRDVNELFDRIVVVGMIEHVGRKNYRPFFELVNRCLNRDGIFLLHTIGRQDDATPAAEQFTDKYIFPNGMLPNQKDISQGIHSLFCIEDWHNIGPHYDKTLMAWHENFHKNWHSVSHQYENPDRFYRIWTFYLLASAALFRARRLQLWQIAMTKGLVGGYISER